MDLEQGLNDAWSGVASFVPKLIGALVIFVIGWIIARVLARITGRVLERVGFNRAVERGGLRRMLEGSRYEPSGILAKIVFWAVLLFTLQFAFGVFGPNPISDVLRGIIGYLPNVFVAVVIMVIAGALATVARDLISNLLSGTAYGRQLGTAAWVAVLVFGAFAAINQLQIAPAIVNALWWAVLAAAVGVTVVALGGGGIPVARRYMERAVGGQGGAAAGGGQTSRPAPTDVGTYREGEEAETPTGEPRTPYAPRHATPSSEEELTRRRGTRRS